LGPPTLVALPNRSDIIGLQSNCNSQNIIHYGHGYNDGRRRSHADVYEHNHDHYHNPGHCFLDGHGDFYEYNYDHYDHSRDRFLDGHSDFYKFNYDHHHNASDSVVDNHDDHCDHLGRYRDRHNHRNVNVNHDNDPDCYRHAVRGIR
jgi:hypothetical protein